MKTINLDKIIKKFPTYSTGNGEDFYHIDNVKKMMLNFGKELLQLAAENAKTIDKKVLFDDPKEGDNAYMTIQIIDKKSITDTINQVI